MNFNAPALLSLIADLYQQLTAAQQRVAELEAALAEHQDERDRSLG